MLFAGFPAHILPSIRQVVDVDGIKRGLFSKKDTTPQECAVELARVIIGRAIAQMPQEEKGAALASFDSESGSHPLHVACGVMHEVAKQMAHEMQVRLLLCEIGGRLRGLTREQIDSHWGEQEVNRISDAMRGAPRSN